MARPMRFAAPVTRTVLPFNSLIRPIIAEIRARPPPGNFAFSDRFFLKGAIWMVEEAQCHAAHSPGRG
jgi:hypothetical protein